VQSVPITTNVVSNSTHGEMYLIQHYVIKFVSDLWQVGGLQHYVIKFVSDLRQVGGFLDQGEVNNIM